MNNDFIQQCFMYRLASGEIILESDRHVLPPQVGAIVRLPSLSNDQEIIPYRIKNVQFAPESQERITIYVEVEPV